MISDDQRLSGDPEVVSRVLREVVEMVPAAITWQDANGVLLGCNRRAARFAISENPEDLVGRPLTEAFRRPADEAWVCEDQELMRSGVSIIGRVETIGVGDHIRFTEVNKVPLRLPGSDAVALLTMTLDRTAQTQAQLEQAADQARLQQIVDTVPAMLRWKGRDHRYLGCNLANAKAMGLDEPGAIVGLRLGEIPGVSDEVAAAIEAEDEEVMATGTPVVNRPEELRGWVRGVDHAEVSLFPVRDAVGEIVGMLSVCVDVSARHQLESDLEQARKLESVGQLAAGIAHEINTPMQYIGDNTHFLKATVTRLLAVAEAAQVAVGDDASDDDRAALARLLEKSKLPILAERAPKAADDALAGVENVSRIVTAMKRFSHPGSESMEPVDLNQAITTTMTVCRNEWKYSAEIETNLADDLPAIEGRLGPLNQVWLNMIVNATHAIADRHGDEKGVITITTTAVGDGEAVRVTIADNGAGIDQENVDRIFDHFFTTKEVGKGTGQGLSLAHQVIVADHNGTISVDSCVGEGTTFTLTLPTSQPATGEDGAS